MLVLPVAYQNDAEKPSPGLPLHILYEVDAPRESRDREHRACEPRTYSEKKTIVFKLTYSIVGKYGVCSIS